MQNIFTHSNYRTFLKKMIEENQHLRGYQSLLAQAAACQRSIISQVLSGKSDLTVDQAAKLIEFWKMGHEEAEYFIDLVLMERAGSPELRKHLKHKLELQKMRQENLAERFKSSSLPEGEIQVLYYSAWYWSAIYVLTSIPQYQTAERISERLRLKPSLVNNVLEKLLEMDLLQKDSRGFKPKIRQIHLPKHSPMNLMNHCNWRQKALECVSVAGPSAVHYTDVLAVSRKDAEVLKNLTLQFIDQVRATTAPSPEEDLWCLTLDFFQPQ